MRRLRAFLAAASVVLAMSGMAAAVSKTVSTDCEAGDVDCVRDELVTVAAADPAAAMAELTAAVTDDPDSFGSVCFELARAVGEAAGEAMGLDAVDLGDPMCGDAYRYGVLLGALAGRGVDELTEAAVSLCPVTANAAAVATCQMGLGAAALRAAGSVEAGLAVCTPLGDAASTCASGLFNEFVQRERPKVEGGWVHADLFSPCTELTESETQVADSDVLLKGCFAAVAGLASVAYTPRIVNEECSAVGPEVAAACGSAVGAELVRTASGPDVVADGCAGSSEFADACVFSAASAWAAAEGGPEALDELCPEWDGAELGLCQQAQRAAEAAAKGTGPGAAPPASGASRLAPPGASTAPAAGG